MSTSRKIGYFTALYRFFRDPSASLFGKAFVFLTVGYVAWPIDLVPDVLPVIGWLDDLGFTTVALWYLTRVASRYREASVGERPSGASSETVDAPLAR